MGKPEPVPEHLFAKIKLSGMAILMPDSYTT